MFNDRPMWYNPQLEMYLLSSLPNNDAKRFWYFSEAKQNLPICESLDCSDYSSADCPSDQQTFFGQLGELVDITVSSESECQTDKWPLNFPSDHRQVVVFQFQVANTDYADGYRPDIEIWEEDNSRLIVHDYTLPRIDLGALSYSETLKFNETDYKICLKASTTNSIHFEKIRVRICTDGVCNMYDIKPEAGFVTQR